MDAEGAPQVAARLYGCWRKRSNQNGKFVRAESFAMAALNEQARGTTDFEPTARTRAAGLLQLSLVRLDLNKFDSALEDAEKALALLSESNAPSGNDLARCELPARPCPARALLSQPSRRGVVRCPRSLEASPCRKRSGGLSLTYWYGQALITSGEVALRVARWWPPLRQGWPRRLIP